MFIPELQLIEYNKNLGYFTWKDMSVVKEIKLLAIYSDIKFILEQHGIKINQDSNNSTEELFLELINLFYVNNIPIPDKYFKKFVLEE